MYIEAQHTRSVVAFDSVTELGFRLQLTWYSYVSPSHGSNEARKQPGAMLKLGSRAVTSDLPLSPAS